jgi:hypothetical protein
MEGYCSTGKSPQWAVVPVEEEEEEEEEGGGEGEGEGEGEEEEEVVVVVLVIGSFVELSYVTKYIAVCSLRLLGSYKVRK